MYCGLLLFDYAIRVHFIRSVVKQSDDERLSSGQLRSRCRYFCAYRMAVPVGVTVNGVASLCCRRCKVPVGNESRFSLADNLRCPVTEHPCTALITVKNRSVFVEN